jgi:hypothetical protein
MLLRVASRFSEARTRDQGETVVFILLPVPLGGEFEKVFKALLAPPQRITGVPCHFLFP